MKMSWVATANGVEVARGATREECVGLALVQGYPEGILLIFVERELPCR